MKGRLNSTVWTLIGINTVVLIAVLGLAYSAGARSGGLSLIDFGALPMVAGFEFLGAIFLLLAGSVTLFVVLALRVLKPVSQMVEFSERLGGGEYTARAEQRPDDFGVAAENFNRAAELLEKVGAIQVANETLRLELDEFGRVIAQVARGDLSARVQPANAELAAAGEAFNAMVEGLLRRVERVRAAAAEATASLGHVMSAAAEMASVAAQQEQSTVATAGSVDVLNGTTTQVAAQANSAAEAICQAVEFAKKGDHAVRESADGMRRIRASMQATAAKIKALGDRSLEIYEIINIIHETNLLALNAVVEASRGGQGAQGLGQSLEVISAEMRKLAEHSRGATHDVVELLKAIQAESNEAVVVMDEGNRVAEAGARLSEQASKAFSEIATVLGQSSELAQTVRSVSGQQAQGTEALAAALQNLVAGSRQNSAKGRQTAKAVEQMQRSAEQLNQAVAQLRSVAGPSVVKAEKEKEKKEVPAAAAGRA